MKFKNSEFWKAIILYGLNNATYKIALALCLIELLNKKNKEIITWDELSEEFLDLYINRLKDGMKPQQTNPNRRTEMERIIMGLNSNSLTRSEAIADVDKAFRNVIPRFHTIGMDTEIAKEKFYEFEDRKKIIIKDSLFEITENEMDRKELIGELDARWSLLEGQFTINCERYELQNDIIEIFLKHNNYPRKNLTKNVPFLNGYQTNTCFYCCNPMIEDDIHVDHVIPRIIVNHDEIWNLVLCHSLCNLNKADKLVEPACIEKLIQRNENIIGSNHPMRNQILTHLGDTKLKRRSNVEKYYNLARKALGSNYWNGCGGSSTDPFYKNLITILNIRD